MENESKAVKRYKLKEPPSTEGRLDFAGELNEQQRAVVTAGAGPLLVIAGAGSGKTHTLTYRMAYLVDRGVAPDRILLLTFTNRAARSMTGRAAALLGTDVGRLWGGTFHSTANRILRQEATRLGYPKDYTIIDFEDSSTLMKACLSDADVGHLSRRFPKDKLLTRVH
ncbi:MAG: UvrD-helicase domain-containing protein, partial [Bradymonadaceae bacterium]